MIHLKSITVLCLLIENLSCNQKAPLYLSSVNQEVTDQRVAYSSVDHQNKHKCQKTIVLDPGLAYQGVQHGSLAQQEHDPLQYLGQIKECTEEEHSFLFQPSL